MGRQFFVFTVVFGLLLSGFAPFSLMDAYAGLECDDITIDNDLSIASVGYFDITIGEGGYSDTAFLFAEGESSAINVLFEWYPYYEIYNTEVGASDLEPLWTTGGCPTLSGDDEVTVSGSFTGTGGDLIEWTAVFSISSGETAVNANYTFDCEFCDDNFDGLLRFHSYLDEDVPPDVENCLLFTRGSVGTGDLELFTFDSVEEYGISQGGAFGDGLIGATFDGWAGDKYFDLQDLLDNDIAPAVSLTGIVDTGDLPMGFDPEFGTTYGPGDVTTVMSYTLDGTVPLDAQSFNLLQPAFAQTAGGSASITTGLGGVPSTTSIPTMGPTPVGGMGVPIDTTALLLASAQSMTLWMIPVIAGIGIGIFVIKKRF